MIVVGGDTDHGDTVHGDTDHGGNTVSQTVLLPLEKELLTVLEQYPAIIDQAALEYDPSLVANYAYAVAKTFNSFYTAHSVASAESEEKKQLRLRICRMTANIIASAMGLLGIRVPERM